MKMKDASSSAQNGKLVMECLLVLFLFVGKASSAFSLFLKDVSEEHGYNGGNDTTVGISPPVLNLATKAEIHVNATCGERGPETYCKLVEHVYSRNRPTQCQVCDALGLGGGKRHPIEFTIDGSNRWWQSPTLQNGWHYQWVTITIDLKQVYQVAYIIIKAGISPRPGNWILERSLDGVDFQPWQFYAISDEECRSAYGMNAVPGKPTYKADDDVICTSYYSRITPFEGGEIHTSLVNGRPGASGPTETLTKFTMARFVRLRLQKIRTLHGNVVSSTSRFNLDKTVLRRYFYSIKDISIGGHCLCFGHANECLLDYKTQRERCMCRHNTCGERCDVCCPLFNQYAWGPGNATNSAPCEPCECYGHASACVYDPEVDARRRSINKYGEYEGGGVCIDCKDFTTGINCEKCIDRYYRPLGIPRDHPSPCQKCECDARGSYGRCVSDEQEALKTPFSKPGDCICKEGFAGKNCDRCAPGYRNFPKCEHCPCNMAGILNEDCEGDCQCKKNVRGEGCSECKESSYNLIERNPDGCTQCFCLGLSNKCSSSNYSIAYLEEETVNWYVTDLYGVKITPIMPGQDGLYHIANEEFASFHKYYWGNSNAFSGMHIHSYGLTLSFHVSWVYARGDTSGRPVRDFDLILQTSKAMFGFGHNYHEGNNASIHVTLDEFDCYVLPDVDNNIIQKEVTPATTPRCSRYEIMNALANVKRILLRARYHTDQIEGTFHHASLEYAEVDGLSANVKGNGRLAKSVEVCECPAGYTASSCHECAYGFRKEEPKDWLARCIPCNCNGHSEKCDFDDNCLKCEHNTTGERCHECKKGFFGDPTTRLKNSCKPCECPLSISSNNFSPTCSMSGNSYKCDSCPVGFEGPFCERCSNGYYGNPAQPGGYCKPCQCSGILTQDYDSVESNICDHLTGECLLCPKNTIGWNCDECKGGHFGNPLNGSCTPCNCDELGSTDIHCHRDTGQCSCRDGFDGVTCDKCKEYHGNPLEGCPPCGCNPLGSHSQECDMITGQCPCKPGVGGRYCNRCLDLHYGFSNEGCEKCNCHADGSDSPLCDLNSGQCHCQPNVVGKSCNKCQSGYWNLGSTKGCIKCSCDSVGAMSDVCDPNFGQCICKPGVGGISCSGCLQNHYGFNESGCFRCDPCNKPGHICHPLTGKCTCPPFTEGLLCDKCIVGCWGFNFPQGCKECSCSAHGSRSPQCSKYTGKCNCLPGFSGEKCDECSKGYYGYPNCAPCDCDLNGSLPETCDVDGICSCSVSGQCQCKDNVVGKQCNRCKDGTYGLHSNKTLGCTECFCFNRTNKCSEGLFHWERLAPQTDRYVSPSSHGRSRLDIINGLLVIPDNAQDIIIEKDVSFSAPLYWQLSHIFLGDKVLSYNGYLRFRTESLSGHTVFPSRVLNSYPLVQIQGNHRLVLEYFQPLGLSRTSKYYEIRLNENDWKLKHGFQDGQVTKEIMMIALQNIQHILIRGTYSPDIFNATLFNVSLDIATSTSYPGRNELAQDVEVCECPEGYNSTSCQNPGVGYYRWYKQNYVTSTVVIDLIGEAKKCECSDRSDICDVETGYCQYCSFNTGGRHCDQCAIGFFGDPISGCRPCPCPSIWSNYADSCFSVPLTYPERFECYCQRGYTGESCDRCEYGYYGDPTITSNLCVPCNCNLYGSVSDECDEITGQCNCRPGVTGRDCSKCDDLHVIIGQSCTSCDDGCTGILLSDIMQLIQRIRELDIDADDAAVWKKLLHLDNLSQELSQKLGNLLVMWASGKEFPAGKDLADLLLFRVESLEESSKQRLQETIMLSTKSHDVHEKAEQTMKKLRSYVSTIQDFITGKAIGSINPKWASSEIKAILDNINAISIALEEESLAAKDELAAANLAYDTVTLRIGGAAQESSNKRLTGIKEKLEDLLWNVDVSGDLSEEALRILTTAQELFDSSRVNINQIDTMSLDMEVKSMMLASKMNEGRHTVSEMEQVLLMIEDMLRDVRNATKDVELRETDLFEMVPMFRAKYAQPAFTHVMMLKEQAGYMNNLLDSMKMNESEALEGIGSYEQVSQKLIQAHELARQASSSADGASDKIDNLLRSYAVDELYAKSAKIFEDGLFLSGIVENSLRRNLTETKKTIQNLKWRIGNVDELILTNFAGFVGVAESEDVTGYIEGICDQIRAISMNIMEVESKIKKGLRERIDGIYNGSTVSAIDFTLKITAAEEKLFAIEHQSQQAQLMQLDFEAKQMSVKDKLRYLKALISQSKHKSSAVKVSIGPDEDGTCFRSYKWPVDHTTSTTISFNFAPTRFFDSLLFYWPSTISEDFMAIEIINLHIKVTWNLGSGERSLIHPLSLNEVSDSSDDPNLWNHIMIVRVGSSVTLDVKPIFYKNDRVVISPLSTAIHYIGSFEESILLDLSQHDLIHVGGMRNLKRNDIVSRGLSGCIHNLKVNGELVGLWSFVTNEGCRPCMQCAYSSETYTSSDQEYSFNGNGYAVVNRLVSNTYNSKIFDMSMKFKTHATNGLLFLCVNEGVGQSISVELSYGNIIFKIRHSWNDPSTALTIEGKSPEGFNTGRWTELRAVWVYQRGTQIGKLIVGNEDFMGQKQSGKLSLNLYDAPYQIGGVSPLFDASLWKKVVTATPFVGCIKDILIGGASYDPLSGSFFGIQSPCSGRIVPLISFDGKGYAEFPSRPMSKEFKLGLSFKTVYSKGLLLLSTFQAHTIQDWHYAIFLVGGKINVVIGLPNGRVELKADERRYDDGQFHSIQLTKNNRKMYLYVDDEEMDGLRLPKKYSTIDAPRHRGLFIGGAPKEVDVPLNPIELEGFAGCIQDFYFQNDILDFNTMIRSLNQVLGQCPDEFDAETADLPNRLLYPNTAVSSNPFGLENRHVDPYCGNHDTHIEIEDPFKVVQFGNHPNSSVTLKLSRKTKLRNDFNITLSFRTYYPNGLFFQAIKTKGRSGYCILSYLKDGQIVVKVHGNRHQDLVSSVSSLNDGRWHKMTIIKEGKRMFLHVDMRNSTEARVPRLKGLTRINLGAVPLEGQVCLENSVYAPDYFKGCLKDLTINSEPYNLNANTAELSHVSPCISRAESGSFFTSQSYAIYAKNFMLNDLMEIEFAFKSDSRNGMLLSFISNNAFKFPSFSITLQDGKIIARESMSPEDYYEAAAEFGNKSSYYVCDGKWHSVVVNYESGSITLRVDENIPVFALVEPNRRNSPSNDYKAPLNTVGSVYIGRIPDEEVGYQGRVEQFYGCIRNLSINGDRRDWTDMSLLNEVYLNSCPKY